MKFFQQFREDLNKQRSQIAAFKEKGQKITSNAAETRFADKEKEKNAARRRLEREQDREIIRKELESKK